MVKSTGALKAEYSPFGKIYEQLHDLDMRITESFVRSHFEPDHSLILVDLLNELWARIRPLATKPNKLKYDKAVKTIRDKCRMAVSNIRVLRQTGSFQQLPEPIWNDLNELRNELYVLRQKVGLFVIARKGIDEDKAFSDRLTGK